MAISTGPPRRQLVFRRYIYFVVALLALSVALGSLSRSEPGGSWLANSYWVLYIVMLLPIIALGAMIVMVVFLALTLRDTSDALGSGMARKARGKKRSKTIHNIIFMRSEEHTSELQSRFDLVCRLLLEKKKKKIKKIKT